MAGLLKTTDKYPYRLKIVDLYELGEGLSALEWSTYFDAGTEVIGHHSVLWNDVYHIKFVDGYSMISQARVSAKGVKVLGYFEHEKYPSNWVPPNANISLIYNL